MSGLYRVMIRFQQFELISIRLPLVFQAKRIPENLGRSKGESNNQQTTAQRHERVWREAKLNTTLSPTLSRQRERELTALSSNGSNRIPIQLKPVVLTF